MIADEAPQAKPRILVVDDELSLAGVLRCSLEQEGFTASEAHDCDEALLRIREYSPDAIVLDSALPPGEGAEAGRRLRAALSDRNVPIILMVPEGRRSECVCPEDGGPDECIAKPFGIADLVSRLRSATQQKPSRRGTKVLSFADVTVDLTARRVLRGGRAVHLGPTEFRLLWFFMEHPYKVFSRSSLLKAIRGSDVGFDFDLRTVDVYVRRLRKSLNVDGSANIIRTVRTAGYSMDIEAGAGLGR